MAGPRSGRYRRYTDSPARADSRPCCLVRFGEIATAEVSGIELDAEPVGGELREAGRAVIRIEIALASLVDLLVEHLQHFQLAIGAFEDALASAVDFLALMVHDLVIFE